MDPYTAAITSATSAIAEAVKADLALDLYLAQESEVYRAALIEQRIDRKTFWKPLLDIFEKLKP